MSMVVAHNISALNTQKNLQINNRSLSKSLEKLSSGFRINTGADGPADLIISEQLRSQTAGLETAIRNTQEAANVISIAEGALNEMNEILKSMRQLALHAANDGITSTEQIAADQAEVDSGISTIDRIAATTNYSGEFLLNGAKGILFDRTVEDGNQMLNLSMTRIDQIFKRSGTVESINFAGEVDTGDSAKMTTQATKAYMESGATTASRLEINNDTNELNSDQRFIVTGSNGSREFNFSQGTELVAVADAINNVAGSTGVEAKAVMLGTGITTRVANVDNDDVLSGSGTLDVPAATNIISAGQTLVFGEKADNTADRVDGVTWENDPVIGKGTDGQGRIFVEWTGTAANATVKLYKADKDPLTNKFDPKDLVAEGTCDITANPTEVAFSARNSSGVNGQLELTTTAGANLPSNVVLVTQTVDRTEAIRDARLDLGGTANGGWQLSFVADGADADGAAGNNISIEMIDPGVKGSTLNASLEQIDPDDATKGYKINVRLATNASTGAITSTAADVEAAILTVASAAGGASVDLFAAAGSITSNAVVVDARSTTFFNGGTGADTSFNIEGKLKTADAISISGAELGVNTDANGKLYFEVTDADSDGQPTAISVYKDSSKSAASLVAKWQGAEAGAVNGQTYFLDEMNNSGLRIALVADCSGANELQNGDSTLTFDMGLRISSSEYGSSEFVRVQSLEGNMWDVQNAGSADANNRGYVNLDASSGSVTMESRGSGAQLSVNGQELFTDGLVAEAATPDFNGHLVFLEGDLGETTVAQVGYNRSTSSSAVGQLSLATNMAANAGVNARETLSNFSNGMQFQLGEGQGDQERTVYGIGSMQVANLGKVNFSDDFYGDGNVAERTLSLSNVLGGGFASLNVDPVKALQIIEQAINDVAGLRARLGAFQSNTLQTNANNLQVTMENVVKTESYIRDADMAAETTDFTKNQILVSAGTSMLAQANVMAQNVLQLLG